MIYFIYYLAIDVSVSIKWFCRISDSYRKRIIIKYQLKYKKESSKESSFQSHFHLLVI